ncbi:uncharacterized protein OCT59_022542 [Rhizophagus irregularis]|uniref:uncharacterized protein n=1 Tax=Rhizophagus irregularis TaxID=588596 RepID=UPI0033318945|nr:hypothetical protein OCT59_022542 [Rhizophagus irregularis]
MVCSSGKKTFSSNIFGKKILEKNIELSESTLKPASDASSTDEIKKTCPGDNTSDSVVDEPAKSAVVKSETKAEVEPP